MAQQLLSLLPKEFNTWAMVLAVAGVAIGLMLWLIGSRFSRTLVTLVSVTTGVVVGLQIPQWFGLALEGWATAILGALVLGISGYVLYKVWVGLGLGIVLVGWAALGCVVYCGGLSGDGKPWVWPMPSLDFTIKNYLLQVWYALSPQLRSLLPMACGGALAGGLALSIMWPRLGTVLLYSCAGISLLLSMGMAVLSVAHPQWLAFIPGKTSSQGIVLVSMVAFGAILQWRCAPGSRRPIPAPARD